jgi:hypothetical protein
MLWNIYLRMYKRECKPLLLLRLYDLMNRLIPELERDINRFIATAGDYSEAPLCPRRLSKGLLIYRNLSADSASLVTAALSEVGGVVEWRPARSKANHRPQF